MDCTHDLPEREDACFDGHCPLCCAAQLAHAQAAINETLQLADFLNDAAANGAGFADHWGERAIQAVEPLRNVTAFAGETLEHNRTLLEYNGRLIKERDELKQRLGEACTILRELWDYLPDHSQCDDSCAEKYQLGLLKLRVDEALAGRGT